MEATGTVRQPLTLRRLAERVEWEGGVIEALEYGIHSGDIDDPEVATVWRRMEQLWLELRPAVRQIERTLDGARRQSLGG